MEKATEEGEPHAMEEVGKDKVDLATNPATKPPKYTKPQIFSLMRRNSYGVPKVKTGKELLKNMFEKNKAPGSGLSDIADSDNCSGEGEESGEETFQGSARPSDKCFEQLFWPDYFDKKSTVVVQSKKSEGGSEEEMSFNLYTAGTKGPLIFCIHGGGYTGLTWALIAKSLKDKYQIAALDMRGHGESSASDDFSAETLASDVIRVWEHKYGESSPQTVLLGHSLGGSVAIKAANLGKERGLTSLTGLIVIDVVEGTALASLPYMQSVIAKRPASFKSVEAIVEWSFSTGMTKNFEAARVSTPSQFRFDEATESYVWITDLKKTEPFWEGWYTGLSEEYLSAPAAKLLLLAGTDRLDKTLTIGQMQGKFQMKVLPTGHAVHEDDPAKTIEAVDEFITRFRIGQ